mgnify:FL=1
MRYIVTQEIKSETQVLWFIYLQDLAFLTVWTMLVLVLKENVHGYLRIPYYIFSFVVGVRMVLRVKGNPKRRYYQALAIYIGRPKNIYRYFKEDKNDERERDSAYPGRHTYYRV